MTTKDEVKALWKCCFADSDEFIDLYFSRRYSDDINMAVCEGGKVISALQMIPYPMTFCGEIIPMAYISGACTHPDYRKHGAMKRLLAATHRRMYADGVWLSTLIPAEEWLFGYYAKSGYASCFGRSVRRVGEESLSRPSDSDAKVEACTSLTDELFHYFDTRMRDRDCCVLHTREDLSVVMADMALGNGKLLVARGKGEIAGMAFVVPDGETVSVKEILADNESVRSALMSEAAYIYKVKELEYMVPAPADESPLGMARVVNAEALLRLFARKHPEQEWLIHLDGDEAVPENNGYYTLKGGGCTRSRSVCEEYRTYSPSSLACLFFQTKCPNMSLMLD